MENNFANVNTVSYKKDELFQTILDDNNVFSEEHFQKVTVFDQGTLQETGNNLDVALDGEGFFVINTAFGRRYTRNGSF